MQQYGAYIRENCLPVPSKKKVMELERAMRSKKSPFARQDPHLPIEGMVINEYNYPISPKHIKQTAAGQLEHRVQATKKAAMSPAAKKTKNELKEDKLAKAVPGYKNARDSQIVKRQSAMDALEGTTAGRVRENGDTSP